MARPARGQQISCEVLGTGELPQASLTGSLKSTLPTRHPGGDTLLCMLHARPVMCTLRCSWLMEREREREAASGRETLANAPTHVAPGFDTITRRERELLLVLQLRSLISNILLPA